MFSPRTPYLGSKVFICFKLPQSGSVLSRVALQYMSSISLRPLTSTSSLTYSLAPSFDPLILLYSSLNSLLKIFPLGFFGILSTHITPPLKYLNLTTFPSTNFCTSSFPPSPSNEPGCLTTHAIGTSSPSPSGIPITATSAMPGCSRSKASSSAGATWLPRTLMSSFLRSTMKK